MTKPRFTEAKFIHRMTLMTDEELMKDKPFEIGKSYKANTTIKAVKTDKYNIEIRYEFENIEQIYANEDARK